MNQSTEKPPFIPERWKDRQGAFYDFRACWWYRDEAGEPQGVVVRFDSDHKKQIIPHFKPHNGHAFKAGGPACPVLFGRNTLAPGKTAFVVEGEKAAAALHSLGLAAVSSQGGAGKAAGGAWDALAGVPLVYLLPDHDKPGEGYARDVARALVALDPPPEVRIVRLPGLPEKGDVVDWLQARVPGWNGFDPIPEDRRADLAAELLAIAERSEPVPPAWLADEAKPERAQNTPGRRPGGAKDRRYLATERGIAVVRFTADGTPDESLLSNFTARITAETLHDDGAETRRLLTLTGMQDGRALPPVHITYEEFHAMQWAGRHWGSRCVVEPGNAKRDILRAAIATLSHENGAVEVRHVYSHTGWRRIEGASVYLHGAGAIGAAGPVAGVEVELGQLSRYALPAPSANDAQRREAAAASLAFLELAPPSVSLPLLACVYLAPLAQALEVDFILWMEAPSQSQKSSLAAVAQAHFGADFDRTNLPASWDNTTANALESKLFALADSLVVVDDYAPKSGRKQQEALDTTVDRVIRSCGNRSGRARLRADLTMRPELHPRGLVVATAEQWPSGESINGRLFGVPLQRGDVDLAALTRAQAAAAGGLLARSMADFVQDLAGRFDAVVGALKKDWLACRAAGLKQGLTGRGVEQSAHLRVGATLAFAHFRRCGLTLPDIDPAEIFYALARRHAQHVLESQPADRFRNALAELLASGAAYLEPVDGNGDRELIGEQQRGRQLGWRNDAKGELYLLAAPALDVVNTALSKGDTGLNIRPRALWRQCQQRGWLQPGNATETGQETTRTVWIAGKSERVLVFNATIFES